MNTVFPMELRRGPTRRRILATSLAGVGGVLLAPSLIGTARAAASIRIGQIEPLTGPSAAYGIRARDGARMAVDEINAAGGASLGKGGKVRLEIGAKDMANDAKQAVTLFRQYAADNTTAVVLGPTNSVGFLAMVPIAPQLKLLAVSDGSGAPIKKWNPWAYRVNPVAATAVPVLLKKVVARDKIKRLAVLYDTTQDAQLGDAEICKEMAGPLGYKIIAYEAFRTGDQHFSAQLAEIHSAKPDAIYVAGATGDGIHAVSQIEEMGFKLPLLTGYGSFADPVYWDGTKGRVKGGFTWLGENLASANGALKEFIDRYNKRFPRPATSFSAYGYDAVYTMAEAIKEAGGGDREKLQSVLSHISLTTPLGTKVTFKNPPTGDNQTPSVVVVEVTGRGGYSVL